MNKALTEKQNRSLDLLEKYLRQLSPGETMELHQNLVQNVPSFQVGGYIWTVVDALMSRIPEASYRFALCYPGMMGHQVSIARLRSDIAPCFRERVKTWMAPDQRTLESYQWVEWIITDGGMYSGYFIYKRLALAAPPKTTFLRWSRKVEGREGASV